MISGSLEYYSYSYFYIGAVLLHCCCCCCCCCWAISSSTHPTTFVLQDRARLFRKRRALSCKTNVVGCVELEIAQQQQQQQQQQCRRTAPM